MKKIFFLCCFFIASQAGYSQTNFLKTFIGHWEGTLLWYKTGSEKPQSVRMQLIIKPADTATTYAWQITYGDKGEDHRPYILQAVDTAKGHWQIDERNGIILDQYFVGGRFTSAFTVQNSTIVNSYWREGENMVAEFYSLSAKPINTTGNGTNESPKVDSYASKSYQRAVMKRIK